MTYLQVFTYLCDAGLEQNCASRAVQIAAVAYAMKSDELKPMDSSSPLVGFLTKALELEEKTDPELYNGHDLAAALLDAFMSALEGEDRESLQYLLVSKFYTVSAIFPSSGLSPLIQVFFSLESFLH